MSKDFEQAYKEAAQMEAPDLWDRIEAGLKSKSVPEEKTDRDIIVSEAKTEKESVSGEEAPEKKADRRRMPVNFPYLKRYSGVIAAAVCVAVILPAMALLRPQFKGYSAADTTEEIAESAAADAGAAENMAMPQEEDGSEAGSIKEAGLETDRETDENGDMPMDAGAGEKDEDAAAPLKSREAATGSADDFSSQPAEAATEEKESSMSDQSTDNGKVSEMGEGTLIKHAVIKVTELKEETDKESEKASGILCTAVLEKTASDSQQSTADLQKKGQLIIFVPSDIAASLYEDGVFEVDLEYRGGREYSFILRKFYQETTDGTLQE
ncbi:MAG: hypothetical protein HFJ00_05145 [Lachnospiraceae bacterium]|jgi:hypothetical protein|nr:hypothetical protein [Lachnospiraceae bacterium]